MRWSTFSTADKAAELVDMFGLDEAIRVALCKIESHKKGAGRRYWADVLYLIRVKEGSDAEETIIEW